MIFFHEQFPDVASKETFAFKATGHCQKCMPDGQYVFLELYCKNPKCDCTECLVEVCEISDDGEINLDNNLIASLKISWNGNGKNGYKVMLRKDVKQPKHANYFCNILKDHMTQKGNSAKIKNHYCLIKKAFKQLALPL